MDERQYTEGIRLLLQMLGQDWRHCGRDVEFSFNNGEVIHRIHVPSNVPWIFFGVSFSVALPALEAAWIVCFQLAYPDWAKPKTWRPTKAATILVPSFNVAHERNNAGRDAVADAGEVMKSYSEHVRHLSSPLLVRDALLATDVTSNRRHVSPLTDLLRALLIDRVYPGLPMLAEKVKASVLAKVRAEIDRLAEAERRSSQRMADAVKGFARNT